MSDMLIGPLMFNLEGTELSQEEIELIRHPLVGGIILFAQNFISPEQITNLTASIRNVKSNILIAVDQEGGSVQRFVAGFTKLPAMRDIGDLYDINQQQACDLARNTGCLMAKEVKAVGVDFSFAPVLDLDKGKSKVIGRRAFHNDSKVIVTLAETFVDGMHQVGMKSVGKHFPGHGSVVVDSHLGLPIDERSLEEVVKDDLVPFAQLTAKGLLDSIMPAHIVFPNIDKNLVGFSSFWLQDILRKQLKFDGVIFSDDLNMDATKVVADKLTRAKLAMKAGCDMILICHDREYVEHLLEELDENCISQQSSDRLVKMQAAR